jgi:ferredoxin-NADP reductase
VPSRIHHAQLLSRRVLANQTVEYVFSVAPVPGESELRFRPGQFISVVLGLDDNQNAIVRSYSIASPPQRRHELAVVLRLVPEGVGSRYFERLQLGEAIRFTGPMGFFVNELSHVGDVVYVATGTGIAPLLPMLEETLTRPEPGRVLLYWGLRAEEDVFWQDELAALAARHPRFSAHIYLSQPRGFTRLRGRVNGPMLEVLPTLRAPTFYLCGNGKMIEELKAALISRGIDRKRQIRTESFFE